MRVAKSFSELMLGVIAVGLMLASWAGAEPSARVGAHPAGASATQEEGEVADEDGRGAGRFAVPGVSPAAVGSTPVAPTVEPAPASVPTVATSVAPAPASSAPSSTPSPPLSAEPPQPAVAKVAAEEPAGGTPGLKPAKLLFGAVKEPAKLAARAIGTYARGCLAGGQALPVDGPTWQAMRLSRNRNWGHPKLIALIERLAADGKAKDDWPGLLVGDLAQPRGGPMTSGHASHQIGLDADIWLTPMPDRRLTNQERETIEATSMLSEDGLAVARDHWTDAHLKIIRRAASYPEVERILVNPAIKQVLCTTAGTDHHWLSKVRPYWGHHYHFHVRIGCPAGSDNCAPQKGVPGDDGCGKELEDWLKLMAKIKPEPAPLPIPVPPPVASKPAKEKPQITLDKLPSECRVVLAAGNPAAARDIAAADKAAVKAEVTAKTKAAAVAVKKPLVAGAAAAPSAKLPGDAKVGDGKAVIDKADKTKAAEKKPTDFKPTDPKATTH